MNGRHTTGRTQWQQGCPLEQDIADALSAAGIKFERESQATKALDFYLPQLDTYIEVKSMHSPRIARQMARAHNVIALQGEKSVEIFCQLLRATTTNPT